MSSDWADDFHQKENKLRSRIPREAATRWLLIAFAFALLVVASSSAGAIRAPDYWETQLIQDASPPCAKFEHPDSHRALIFENSCTTGLTVRLDSCKGVDGSIDSKGSTIDCRRVEASVPPGEKDSFIQGVFGGPDGYEKGDVLEVHYQWEIAGDEGASGTIVQRATFRGRRDSGGCACGSGG